ncbi:DAZ-associated protein, putative [Perkinsus marinus ATCC 50983]|uniref:DAZ-associated protein, putative n=1 Tax=Perkinsus marinus (strain ATCC 50983 / TXsc) TaxID=423536 RepID=C5KKJ4_PERM5|nr:DAZ-associated protein, putative [Perkinsus marinus ATCC 50983]EER15106.1 DAZ-associated protein, putative [Perkinsus marinus ATCC 50983]|eukprot:XP_002783310.1 DAZ-associated protein, putative [Perkinsus marinus ATCC 50983]
MPSMAADRMESTSVKLFVRGLPVHYPESDLRAVFEEYGMVEDVFILRDRSTMQSRGMAFVRFRDIPSGMAAIKALNGYRLCHNTSTSCIDNDVESVNDMSFAQSHIPLSVSLAQGEAERLGMHGEVVATGGDTKLFVSGLGPGTQEEELRTIFEPFGRINEVHVPGPHALYAFVRFAEKEDALKAIREVNGRVTVEGSQRPLEVKVAESRAAKADRNAHHQQQQHGYEGVGATGLRLMAGAAASLPINGATSSLTSPGRLDTPTINGIRGGSPSGTQAPRTAGVWTEYFTMDDTPYYHNARTNEVQWEMPAEFRNPINVHTAPQTKGPPGANVFVFWVPDAWTEDDLRDHFSSFGNIVSAKVVVDKHTGLSRGYGFISYDNAQSAGRAVAEMNGFVAANGRRIKVQIKKGEEDAAVEERGRRGRSSSPY